MGADEDLTMHCFESFLRAFVLLGGFMVAQHFLGIWRGSKSKPAPRKVCTKVGVTKAAASRANIGRQRIPVKQLPKAMSDDEDAGSTSAGSSDDTSDILSSEEDEEVEHVQPGRISKADLLSLRPAQGNIPAGGLRAMRIDQQRSWASLRSVGPPPVLAKGGKAKETPLSKSTHKANPAPKPPAPKLPLKADGADATPGLLTPSRVEALLQICCPDTPVTLSMALGTDVSTAKTCEGEFKGEGSSPASPPWRKKSA